MAKTVILETHVLYDIGLNRIRIGGCQTTRRAPLLLSHFNH